MSADRCWSDGTHRRNAVTQTRGFATDTIELGRALKHGAIGGIVAGIVFPLFEMAMAAIQGQSPFGPLRMIGGIALGEQALDPSFSLLIAGAAGVAVHMMLSIMYGAVFGAAAAFVPAIVRSMPVAALAGAVWGIVLWLVNFYVAAPIFGWAWFPQMTDALVQFVAHAGFFGVPLGLYVAWALRRRTVPAG
jgi:hypothetical protein